MSEAPFSISKTIISPASRESFLPLSQPWCEPLRRRGVQLAGLSQLVPPYELLRPKQGFHSLNLTLGGEVVFDFAGTEQRLTAGTIWVVPAETACGYRIRDGGRWRTLWFHLRDVEQWSFLKGQPPHRRAGETALITAAAEALLAESVGVALHAAEAAHAHAELIAIYIERLLHYRGSPRQEDAEMLGKLETLWNEVDGMLYHRWTAGDLAGRLEISESTLQRLVLRHYQTTPLRRITELRMRRAQELLEHSTQTLDEIAAHLGYATGFAFSKAFRKWAGIAPQGYRRRQKRV